MIPRQPMLSAPSSTVSVVVIGIGNELAGDDGAGVVALRQVEKRFSSRCPEGKQVEFAVLGGDLYSVTDFCYPDRHLLFLDAIAGNRPGELVTITGDYPAALAPSLHQLDICSVMRSLRQLELCLPFPSWEVRGITIATPEHLGIGLSRPVEIAVDELAATITGELQEYCHGLPA